MIINIERSLSSKFKKFLGTYFSLNYLRALVSIALAYGS
jgi:hypothetical protein